MADEPAAPPKSAKRVLGLPLPVVVGGAVFAAAAIWLYLKRKQAAAPAADSTTAPTDATVSPADLSAIQEELSQLLAQGGGGAGTGPAGTPPDATPPGTTPPAAPPPAGGNTVRVPAGYGLRANQALANLAKAGLKGHTVPARDPKHTYVVTGETPKGGTMVPRGTDVAVKVKILK